MLDRTRSSTILDLSGHRPVASGAKQSVYAHPENPRLLVKVLTEEPEKRRLIPRYGEFRYGSFRPWHREASEYLSVLNRGARGIERLSGFFGFVPTSRGPGLLVEKLTGPNGRLAPTLRDLIRGTEQGSRMRDILRDEVEDLLADLYEARIIVGDLHARNIVRATERDNRLVVIDGLGERTLLPITQFSQRAYNSAHERRRRILLRSIRREKYDREEHAGNLILA